MQQPVFAAALHHLPFVCRSVAAVPHERAIHNRILQPFGRVHGNDFDQMLVAFQTQQPAFRAAALGALGDFLCQPLLQCGFVAPLFVFRRQKLHDLADVGQHALAALRQQPRYHAVLLQKTLHGGIHAPLLPILLCLQRGFRPIRQLRVIGQQRLHVGRRVTEQAACKHINQQFGFLRFEPEFQQRAHGGGFFLCEQVFAAHQHALDTVFFQRALHKPAVAVAADEHGNLPGFQRQAADMELLLCRQMQRMGDFAGAPVGGAVAQGVGGFGCVTAFVQIVQPADAHRRFVFGQAFFRAAGGHGFVGQVVQRERFVAGEQCADAVDEPCVAAVVGGERVAVFRFFGGGQIGKDVCAAEAVNGLFRVAHHEPGRGAGCFLRVGFGGEGTAENVVLQRVGVLEFVNQRHTPLPRHRLRQGGGIGAVFLQRVEHVQQQVVKLPRGLLLFAAFVLHAPVVQQGERQPNQRVLFCLFRYLRGFGQSAQRVFQKSQCFAVLRGLLCFGNFGEQVIGAEFVVAF